MKTQTKLSAFAVIVLIFLTTAFVLMPTTSAVCAAEGYTAGKWGAQEFSDLWYYGSEFLDIAAAKDIVSQWDFDSLGDDPIVIAVVDTGIDTTHELFSDMFLTDDNGNILGYNSYSNASGMVNIGDTSSDKHGNAVAGIIAMMVKEFGLQDYIKIYPIKANTPRATGNQNSFSIASIVSALGRAKQVGADIINLSLGKHGESDWKNDSGLMYALRDAAENSLIVAAAGNTDGTVGGDSSVESNKFYPAATDGVLSVMGYGKDGDIYSTSDYGPHYDIAAPGEEIYTAANAVSQYSLGTGTSYAAPIVAFAAALLKLRFRQSGLDTPDGYRLSLMLRNLNTTNLASRGDFKVKRLDFTTVLTQDFSDNGTYYEYSTPVGIELTHNATLGMNDNNNNVNDEYADAIVMRADKVYPITFLARLQPYGETNPELDKNIDWILRDALGNEYHLFDGPRFEYTADSRGFGDTQIIARLKMGDTVVEQSQRVYVQYLPYLVGDVRVTYQSSADLPAADAPGSGTLYTNTTTVFTLTGLQYLDKTVPIKWYVNGQHVATGQTFAFKPKKSGTYRISAQYGDQPLVDIPPNAFVANVKSFILRPLDLSMLIISLVIIIAVATIFITLRCKKIAKR